MKKKTAAVRRQRAELAPLPGMKLDLGCGQSPKEGFEGVDISSTVGAKHVVDLWKFPWPFADNSVTEIHCSHHVEHIPARTIEPVDLRSTPDMIGLAGEHYEKKWSAIRDRFFNKDMFFAFFDECYRIMQPDAWMTVVVPSAQSVRAFQDPTHRRFIVAETFLYLTKSFREANKLDHYRVECGFEMPEPVATIPEDVAGFHLEAQVREMRHKWNIIQDWHVKLKAKKPAV